MKILLSGAQCVGKTTLINSLKSMHPDWVYFDEIVRKLAQKGIKVSEMGDDETQIAIMKEHLLNLECNAPWAVYDRGVLDCYAHSAWMYSHGKLSRDVFVKSEKDFTDNIMKYDYVFFIMPEFDIVDDGFRSVSKEFQNEMSDIFLGILYAAGIKHTRLWGSVVERLKQIHASMGLNCPGL